MSDVIHEADMAKATAELKDAAKDLIDIALRAKALLTDVALYGGLGLNDYQMVELGGGTEGSRQATAEESQEMLDEANLAVTAATNLMNLLDEVMAGESLTNGQAIARIAN